MSLKGDFYSDNEEDLKGRETELEKRRSAREGLEEALVFITHKLKKIR
jgi:hypothetical protein